MAAPMIQVGVHSETVAEARKAINDVLASNNDQPTKRAALETLRNLCKVENTSITNCTFSSAAPKKVRK